MDTYVVSGDTPEPGDDPGGRAFWVYNVTDPTSEEPYRTVLSPRADRCTCKAGRCRTESCKHRDALDRLVEMGDI